MTFDAFASCEPRPPRSRATGKLPTPARSPRARRSPLDDRQVSWCDFALDADLVQGVLGHPSGASPLYRATPRRPPSSRQSIPSEPALGDFIEQTAGTQRPQTDDGQCPRTDDNR